MRYIGFVLEKCENDSSRYNVLEVKLSEKNVLSAEIVQGGEERDKSSAIRVIERQLLGLSQRIGRGQVAFDCDDIQEDE